MRGAPKAPRRDTRSPFLIIGFRWRRDCLEREYTTRRGALSVRWSTKGRSHTPGAALLHRSSPMSVRSAPACPPQHAHELAVTVDATHLLPIVSGFRGGEAWYCRNESSPLRNAARHNSSHCVTSSRVRVGSPAMPFPHTRANSAPATVSDGQSGAISKRRFLSLSGLWRTAAIRQIPLGRDLRRRALK